MDPLPRLQPIADRVVPVAFEDGLSSLQELDRVFFLAWSYAAELSNGGHAQFFFNSGGNHTPESYAAVLQLGLPEHAKLLQAAGTLLLGSAVPRDQDRRNELLDELSHEVDSDLEALDDRFLELGGGDVVLQNLDRWYFDATSHEPGAGVQGKP